MKSKTYNINEMIQRLHELMLLKNSAMALKLVASVTLNFRSKSISVLWAHFRLLNTLLSQN